MDMKLEVVVVPVADVDRSKDFYQGMGWRLDIDVSGGDDFRAVQLTPPGSNASIIFGRGVTTAEPGSIDKLVLAVDDIEATRDELLSHGVKVGEVFHDIRLVHRSRRQWLAPTGDQGAAPGPGVTDGRCGSGTAG